MKKIISLVLALGIIFGVGSTIENTVNNAGEPPIGSLTDTTTQVADGGFTTYGEPPIGS
jgi:hypothetical protein